jgi:hypothetical protein
MPKQSASVCAPQGPATAAFTPASGRALRGGSTRPLLVPGSTQPGSKRPFDLQRSAATCEGWGGTLPPHGPPAHARAASSTNVRRLSPGTPRAGDRGPPAPRPGGPALDAGALRQYSAEPSTEGGKTTAGARQADTVLRGSPRRRGEPLQESAGAARPLTSRSEAIGRTPVRG